jgi:hypothetical protein
MTPSALRRGALHATIRGEMLSLYLFSLIVGGVLLAAAAFGGGHGHDHSGAFDHAHHDTDGAAKFLSLRTLTYFLFGFGGVGGGLSWAGMNRWLALPIALTLGFGVAALVGLTFRYLARTDSGERSGEDSFVGLQGKVVLPIADGGLGKVMVQRGDRTYELVARPLDASATGIPNWKAVVVVEMNRGTALVAPLDEPALLQQDGS